MEPSLPEWTYQEQETSRVTHTSLLAHMAPHCLEPLTAHMGATRGEVLLALKPTAPGSVPFSGSLRSNDVLMPGSRPCLMLPGPEMSKDELLCRKEASSDGSSLWVTLLLPKLISLLLPEFLHRHFSISEPPSRIPFQGGWHHSHSLQRAQKAPGYTHNLSSSLLQSPVCVSNLPGDEIISSVLYSEKRTRHTRCSGF